MQRNGNSKDVYDHGSVFEQLFRGVKQYFVQNMGILLGLVLICTLLTISSKVFFTEDNFFNVLRQVSTNMNLALGMTLVIILGGIDLSVGSIVALTGTLTVGLITNSNMNIYVAMLLGLATGTVLGLITGLIIANTGMPSFIVSLAMMNIARGAAYIYSGGLPIRSFDETFSFFGTGYLGAIPVPVIFMAVFIVIIALLLNYSKFGTYVYAVGGNREAARFSGIPIKKVEVLVYTISGALSAFSGIILASRMFSGQPSVAQGFELDAIAACVLGGVSMSGGLGKVGGAVLGVLVIGIINNGLNLLNVNSFYQLIVKGVIILLAVYIDMLKKQNMLRN